MGERVTFLGQIVRLVGSREAQTVTGLSADQLREWTGRRGLVSPDVPARGKGTQARFGWQTLLVLRIACAMKEGLHVELGARRDLFADLQRLLADQTFHGLWGHSLLLVADEAPTLRRAEEIAIKDEVTVLVMSLRPHLEAIMRGFGIAEPMAQLPLFPAIGLR